MTGWTHLLYVDPTDNLSRGQSTCRDAFASRPMASDCAGCWRAVDKVEAAVPPQLESAEPDTPGGNENSQRLRIVFLTNQWQRGHPSSCGPYSAGGAEQVLFDLATNLDRARISAAVCTVFGEGSSEYCQRAREAGLTVLAFPMGNRPGFRMMVQTAHLARYLRRSRVDIAHCSGDRGIGVLAAAIARVPVIIETVHDALPPPSALDSIMRWLSGRLLLTHTVAVSGYVARDCVARRFRAQKDVSAIRNGVTLGSSNIDEQARRAVRQAVSVPDDAPLIVTAARLIDAKGVDILVRSVPAVVEAAPATHVMVLGDGPRRAQLENLSASLGVSNRVHFVGQVSETRRYLEAADAFCMPSRSEGLGIAALEAMEVGLPVVAARVGGTPEVVEHGTTGLLVVPRLSSKLGLEIRSLDLAQSLVAVLQDPQKAREMGRAGRERVAESFSLEQFVEQYERLYFYLVNEHRRKSA